MGCGDIDAKMATAKLEARGVKSGVSGGDLRRHRCPNGISEAPDERCPERILGVILVDVDAKMATARLHARGGSRADSRGGLRAVIDAKMATTRLEARGQERILGAFASTPMPIWQQRGSKREGSRADSWGVQVDVGAKMATARLEATGVKSGFWSRFASA